jgi:nucleolar protein 58
LVSATLYQGQCHISEDEEILHSQIRFKLKFSPDKVDTMVVQAIALLDDLDKEINIYSMRVKVDVRKSGARLRLLTGPRNGTVGISRRWQKSYQTIWHMPKSSN